MKLKVFVLSFLFSISLFAQSNIHILVNKNLLPNEEVQVQVSGYRLASRLIKFEIYKINDPLKFATSDFDFINFTDEQFNQLLMYFDFVSHEERIIETREQWFVQNFNLGKIKNAGSYLIRASVLEKSAYAFFNCSDLGLISKRSIDEILIYVSNRKNSNPVEAVDLKLISLDKKIHSLKTDKFGVAYKKIGDRPEDRKLYTILNLGDISLISLEPVFSPSDEYNKYLVYTYTNQPVYRPKQKVNFKSIIRLRETDDLITAKNLEVRVKALMPDNSTFFDTTLITNSFGSINGVFEIPEEAPIGNYTILLEIDRLLYPTTFSVEEYRKPEYKVTVETDKSNYTENETAVIKVTAEYFFGEKLQKGDVKLLVYRTPLYRRWWEFEPFANFYRRCFVDIIPVYQPELISEIEGELTNGEFKHELKFEKDIGQNYEYQVIAYVRDETNREISANQKFYVTKYRVSVTTNPDRYFYPQHSNAIIKVVTTDFSFKPLSKKFKVIIQKVHIFNFSEFYEDIDTLAGVTQSDGIGYISYKVKDEGKYSYQVIVEDENKIVSVRSSFYVGDKNIKLVGARDGLQVIPAKDIFNETDELEFLIISPIENVKILVTIEQSNIHYYKVIKLEGTSTSFKIKKSLPSVVHISAGFYYENQYFNAFKRIGILRNDKKLDIEILSDKNTYKPGEKGKFTVKVKDNKGNPVKNVELSSSIIDESIFSIKPEQSQNIFEFFSQATLYKIYTLTTEIYNFITPPIRPVVNGLSETKQLIKKGNSTLIGKLINSITKEPVKGANLTLINDNVELKTLTDNKGVFQFKLLPAGIYKLLIEAPLFERKIISSVQIVENKKVNVGEIFIDPQESEPSLFQYSSGIKDALMITREIFNTVSPEVDIVFSKRSELKEFVEPKIRKDFRDALYWNASLLTDENGEVNFEITYPDNLTSWRNSVKAISVDSKTGETFINVIVKKNILIRVEVPRYVHEKDEISLPVLVHNYSDSEQEIRIQFEVINGEIINEENNQGNLRYINSNTRETVIKKDEVLKTSWRVKINSNADELIVIAKALVLKSKSGNTESDGIELKVPIKPQGIPIVNVSNFSLSKSKENYLTTLNTNKELKGHKIVLKLSPTLIGSILSSIDELVGYPYGCVEQTMSRFLPSIVVANLIKELNIELKSKTLEELPKVVTAGLKRLKDLQHNTGGWGWWEYDQTNPYMTAYVMYGLALTKSAGYPVDEKMFSNGLNSLKNMIELRGIDQQTLAYLLWAFSSAKKYDDETTISDLDLIKKTFNRLIAYNTDPFIVSHLLKIAIQNKYDDKYIQMLKRTLLRLAKVQANMVYWGEDLFAGRFTDDRIEITSSVLHALILSGEKSNLVENGIRWLMNQKQGNFWYSTKQTASVILSLVEYLKQSAELDANFTIDIKVNDVIVKSMKFSKKDLARGEFNIDLTYDLLKDSTNQIEITKTGKGKLYCSLIEKYFVENIEFQEKNFSVERKYYKLSYEKDGEKLVKKISELKDTIKVGERILVEIKVKSEKSYEYFMLEDPLVPGFDYLSSLNEQDYASNWYQHRELKDQKAAFFMTNYNIGEVSFSYLTYAQLPGKYFVPVPIASLMYYPDIRGFGKEKTIVVVE